MWRMSVLQSLLICSFQYDNYLCVQDSWLWVIPLCFVDLARAHKERLFDNTPVEALWLYFPAATVERQFRLTPSTRLR
jgi:hypothetical protein